MCHILEMQISTADGVEELSVLHRCRKASTGHVARLCLGFIGGTAAEHV